MNARVAVAVGGAALALVLLAAPALAQDGPLTTLLKPPANRTDNLARQNNLFGDNPLANVDALARGGSLSNQPAARRAAGDSAKPGEAGGCDQSAEGTAPGVASGGSGLGEYGRFVNGGQTAETRPPAPGAPAREATGDRPLLSGTERPLWGDAAPSAAGQTGAGSNVTSDAQAPAARAAGVDRPLWADAGAVRSAAGAGCDGTPRAGVARAPTQTLFFGIAPTR